MVDRATKETFELTIERRIEARRRRVFQAFTDVDDLSQWYAPEELDVTEVSADVRVGGKWNVVMRHQGLPTVEARDRHREGWSSCFDRLERMFS